MPRFIFPFVLPVALVVAIPIFFLAGCEKAIQKAAERDARIMERARAYMAEKAGVRPVAKNEACPRGVDSFFTQSLHYTGEGMRYWYEEAGGFMEITGIPYADLDCGSCHVRSCDRCHAVSTEGGMRLSKKKVRDIGTCLPCHGREELTYNFDRAANSLDVHMAAGMVCADCHDGEDVHGDGVFRHSMRSPGGVNVTCERCHNQTGGEGTPYDPTTASHSVHGDRLACQACHVSNTTACMNCHFGEFVKTGERKGNFIPVKKWVLLINHEGKVTSGSAMSLVYDKKGFLAYVPYYTHSVQPEGRRCGECHDNAAIRRINNGERVPVMAYENGETVHWQGVVPLAPESLDFVFLDKEGEKWRPLPADTEPMVQFAAYGEPMTPAQLEMLGEPMSE